MTPDALSTLISRFDFALISSVHITYPPMTIGLAIILFVAELMWVRTNDEKWYRWTRFMEKLFIVNFGAGVATGVTMEMAFGILYGPFSQATGPFFGQVLGYETISAFMYEAGFIGLMIFGWGKISKGMHLFSTFNVALSSTLSAMWIMIANSWMQSPAGVELKDGFFHVTSWYQALINPNFVAALPHMVLAALEIALCFTVAVAAWFVLKRRNTELFLRPLKIALVSLTVVAAVQIYMGDVLGENVLEHKPAALAAMEGHYHTHNADGSVSNAWHVIGWPNKDGDGMAWSIDIPHGLSLIETKTWNGAVKGLNEFPKDQQPPVVLPFYSFRVMAVIGGLIFLAGLWGCWLMARGKLTINEAFKNRLFLRAVIAMSVLPYLAILGGWWTREIGRQPWLVYGMMTVKQGVSHMSVGLATFWFVGFAIFEAFVFIGTFYYFLKICRKGPDMTSPVAIKGAASDEADLDLPTVGTPAE